MSRSYKKYTCCSENCSKANRRRIKRIRRTGNRIINNSKEVKNGNYYKKIFKYYHKYSRDKVTLESFALDYLEYGKGPEEAYSYWIKEYYFK